MEESSTYLWHPCENPLLKSWFLRSNNVWFSTNLSWETLLKPYNQHVSLDVIYVTCYVQESWQCFALISLYVICQCYCHRRQTQDDAWWEANGNHGRWAFFPWHSFTNQYWFSYLCTVHEHAYWCALLHTACTEAWNVNISVLLVLNSSYSNLFLNWNEYIKY